MIEIISPVEPARTAQELWGSAPHTLLPNIGHGLLEQRALVPPTRVRPCPSCSEPTTQPKGDCDRCTGELRPVCRMCNRPDPSADWSASDPPLRHYFLDTNEVCVGSALPVTILN